MGDKRIRRVALVPPIPVLPSGEFKKRRVAAYARVSTASDEQENSLAAQRSYYEAFILKNQGWEFVDVYFDDGISGLSSRNRDGFNKMVEDALEGKIDLILTKSLSRFARNTVDTLTTIRRLKEHNVEVFFEKENIYTFDSKGEFLITLMSSIAQEESRSLSENVTWGHRKRFADGKYTMPYRFFLGYKRGPEGTPVIDEDEAWVVKLIYLLYLEGYSTIRLRDYLEVSGIAAPMGVDWHPGTIQSMLSNEKYKGDALLQKRVTVDYLTKKSKKNEGEAPQYYIEDAHPAIVSKEVWQLVQEERGRRYNLDQKYSAVNPLASKIICEHCGSFYGLKSTIRSGVFYGMFWRCNAHYINNCKSLNFLEETMDDYCKLMIGDLFAYYNDVIIFCSKLLLEYTSINPMLISEASLREWFVNQLDSVMIDATTLRTLIKAIYPEGYSHIRFQAYDGVECEYQADKKGKMLQNVVREIVTNRAMHYDAPSQNPPEKRNLRYETRVIKPITEEDGEQIRKMRLEGHTYQSIANTMEIGIDRIMNFCHQNKINRVLSVESAQKKMPARFKIRVTDDIWTKVFALRVAGYSVKEIHEITGLKVETIRSRCHRYGFTGWYAIDVFHDICKYCGKPLEHVEGKKKKEFCCDNCRMEWWAIQRRAEKIKAEFLEKKS